MAVNALPDQMTLIQASVMRMIVLPNGQRAIERREALIDNAMVKLIARGHRWHRQLFDGTHASIADIAKSENINPSFVSRILRLAYLSPTLVEAILDGKYPAMVVKPQFEVLNMTTNGI